ncbi:hypothetical protein [Herbiconiux sp. VKM Ac-2851]|uniref:hypothetical protein n=1 Tax=Herbiconiux sp. VKM Ac-2851 TaxID=2739025 RepID=UPI001566C72C|nr:hypothetical protein [Herbiconiux sp. VKM Ac-2851]NQX33891.1 hypothetical protein [Herbiconiux sp. VKM Ac-2851]
MPDRDPKRDFRRPELSTPWQRLSGHRAFAPVVVVAALLLTSLLVYLALQRFL